MSFLVSIPMITSSLTIFKDDSEPDWMIEHARKEKKEIALRHRDDLEHRLAVIRDKELKAKRRNENGQPPHKRPVSYSKPMQKSCLMSSARRHWFFK